MAELQAAVASFAPERVAARCDISADTIRQLTRDLAAAPRACVCGRTWHLCTCTCTQAYRTLAGWLIDLLNTLTGNLDPPGGGMFSNAPAFAANTAGKPNTDRGVASLPHGWGHALPSVSLRLAQSGPAPTSMPCSMVA